MSTALKIALKRAKKAWSERPRSLLELYEFTRDDCILTPTFQWVWWWAFFMITMMEVAIPTDEDVYMLMIMLAYVIFTLPCLRFCSVWTKLYQQRRNAKPPEEEPEEEKPVKQKKKKAMTEEEMLEATRKRQKNRKDEGATKGFAPTKKKKERGAKKPGNAATEDNIGGVISELQIKTVK